MKLSKDKHILIVGLGLIGGSYAEGLTKKGYIVGAITDKQEDIDYALDKGIISSGKVFLDKDYISSFDVVIFALYPHIFLSWIQEHQELLKSGALLTDVTGVKQEIVYKVQDLLRDDLTFVGAHPMAGREVYGIKNADCNIFKGANYIVTPTDKNKEADIELVEDIGRALEFKNISRLSPEKHDEMIGFLSQLTHCIAVALMNCKESKELYEYTGDSFRDLTRIAKINEDMWTELFLLNKEELISQIDLFIASIKDLREALFIEDVEKMKEMMRLSTERRKYFDKK